jgi:predicted transport protein
MENYNRKERVNVEQYTIEHIMPQNPNLSEKWKEDLGSDWLRIHETWLHTLGNLTLTGYNSEYSDSSFQDKRDMENGFKDSPIKLNESLRNIDIFNETEIIRRADLLSKKAIIVWEAPNLSLEVLKAYKEVKKEKSEYDIADFPFLSKENDSYSEHTRNLYDLLIKEILAIDENVTIEFFKIYIAFKAETNFVDIVPYSKKLNLVLNMPYSEISDPEKKCRDVSKIGKWGNGEVEFNISNESEIPYALGLIRQSFEKQMNNEES